MVVALALAFMYPYVILIRTEVPICTIGRKVRESRTRVLRIPMRDK